MLKSKFLKKIYRMRIIRAHVRQKSFDRAVFFHERLDGLFAVAPALVFLEKKNPDLTGFGQINSAGKLPGNRSY